MTNNVPQQQPAHNRNRLEALAMIAVFDTAGPLVTYSLLRNEPTRTGGDCRRGVQEGASGARGAGDLQVRATASRATRGNEMKSAVDGMSPLADDQRTEN
jgi:hypothetical protein